MKWITFNILQKMPVRIQDFCRLDCISLNMLHAETKLPECQALHMLC